MVVKLAKGNFMCHIHTQTEKLTRKEFAWENVCFYEARFLENFILKDLSLLILIKIILIKNGVARGDDNTKVFRYGNYFVLMGFIFYVG